MKDRLLKPQEVADLLQTSRTWVYDEARAGRLPSLKLSPQVLRFRASDIEAFLTTRTGGPQ